MYLLLNFSHTTFRKNIADSMPSCFSLGFIPLSSFHIQREKCQLLSDMAMPLKILCGAIGCVWSYRVSTKFIIRNCKKTSLCDYTENLGQSNSKGFIIHLGSVLMSGLSSASLFGPWDWIHESPFGFANSYVHTPFAAKHSTFNSFILQGTNCLLWGPDFLKLLQ